MIVKLNRDRAIGLGLAALTTAGGIMMILEVVGLLTLVRGVLG